jgi:arsenical pump membrane protein
VRQAYPSRFQRCVRTLSDIDVLSLGLLGFGGALSVLGFALRGPMFVRAASVTVRPFVEVGAVVIGGWAVARWGLLDRVVRPPSTWGGKAKVSLVLGLTAALAGLVNLDVAVVMAMPLALGVASEADLDVGLLAIAVANVANATSFLLPTANLTNLLVMGRGALPLGRYVESVWVAWIGVSASTVVCLVLLLGSRAATGPAALIANGAWSLRRIAMDLVAMFLLASGLRALWSGGVRLPGGFATQTVAGSALASAADNLPVSTVVHAGRGLGPWTAILAMSMGANLFLTGSVATVLCRRLSREGGVAFSPRRFALVGGALLPIQLAIAFLGLRLTGAIP